MPRGFMMKMRGRFASAGRKKARVKKELRKLEHIEERLEKDIGNIEKEIITLESVEEYEKGKPREFGWIKGRITTLVLQDFVGAAFGAIFFVVTQEIWELSARLGSLNLSAIFLMSFLLTFLLVYLSRRRRYISTKLYHTVFLRALEIYSVSLITAFIFVGMFDTASGTVMLSQSILVALPATISAATADFLFY